jgi:OmpA-OmpF porin, OOP family
VFGGYNLTKELAIEAAYGSLGKTSGNVLGVPVEIKADSLDIAGVFKLPITSEFSGFGKLGVSSVKTEGSAGTGGVSFTTSDRTTQLLAGLGLTYNFSKDVSFRGEWENRRVELEGDKNTVNTFTIGAQFNF